MSIMDTIEKLDGMISVDELSRLLGVSSKTLYKAVKAGRLPAYRVAGIRLDPSDVARWLRDRHTGK